MTEIDEATRKLIKSLPVSCEKWQTFMANALAKHPDQRSAAENYAIKHVYRR